MHPTSMKNRAAKRVVALTALVATSSLLLSACSGPSGSGDGEGTGSGEVSLTHYFSDAFGEAAFKEIIPMCETETGATISNGPMGQEAFKDSILVQLAGGNPPSLASYWAGAKTASLVEKDLLRPIDGVWEANDLDAVIPSGMTESASVYDGEKYLLPFVYHYVGLFYNPTVMADAGITDMPATWDELMDAADKLKANGVTPFALGSKDRWPAQFWFDYILLRTAGPDYRAQLMSGEASYTDPEVARAFEMWKELFDKGYFNDSPNGIDANDAANQVSGGTAAMTLMGTWVTGAWDSNGVEPVTGYDMFPFPEIDPGVEPSALGPVDGWIVPAKGANSESTDQVLACLASADAQRTMALTAGGLAPNVDADMSEQNQVMQNAAKIVAETPSFNFNYDLATPPEVSSEGLNMLAMFVDSPASYEDFLAQLQAQVESLY